MTNKNNFERILRDKADRLRVSPSSRAWNQLDRKLSQSNRRASGFSFSSWAIAASLVLLFSFAFIFYLNGNKSGNTMASLDYTIAPLDVADYEANISIVEINRIYQDLARKSSSPTNDQIINRIN